MNLPKMETKEGNVYLMYTPDRQMYVIDHSVSIYFEISINTEIVKEILNVATMILALE